MNNETENLEEYLSHLYRGIPITDVTRAKLEALKFKHDVTRYHILITVDEVIDVLGSKANHLGTPIGSIKVVVDKDHFSLRFDPLVKEQPEPMSNPDNSKDKLAKLFSILGGLKATPIDLGSYDAPVEDEMTETDIKFQELEVINKAVNIIIQIETTTQSLSGWASSLKKYIPAIEARYLTPYVPIKTEELK